MPDEPHLDTLTTHLEQDRMGISLNAICPYYTMFPLDFPAKVIAANRRQIRGWVVDPFCGRGTTNLAARIAGVPTAGVDSSPIAVAIARAKLCRTTVQSVVRAVERILEQPAEVRNRPCSEFWKQGYSPSTLTAICRIREALLNDCSSDARLVLRAIMLGALHGPLTKRQPSHLSNQCPRTYAPKPDYAVRFWSRHQLTPPVVDVIDVVRVRAERFLRNQSDTVEGCIRLGDSRTPKSLPDVEVGLVVTSPPYYGMRTYIPDQWLRSWFLGGPSRVNYKPPARELSHSSPEIFISDLRTVWSALADRAVCGAKLAIRFGGINDRDVDHVELMKESLRNSGWRLQTIVEAGDADAGRRQANQFLQNSTTPKTEHDFYAVAS